MGFVGSVSMTVGKWAREIAFGMYKTTDSTVVDVHFCYSSFVLHFQSNLSTNLAFSSHLAIVLGFVVVCLRTGEWSYT